MDGIGEVAQLVGALGSVLVAAVAIVVNNRTTRAHLDAQRKALTEQLRSQREALTTTLTAQEQQIRDERLWDRRMALYEDLGEWSGRAFSSASRLMFAVEALSAKGFKEQVEEPLSEFFQAAGDGYFPLFGRVQLYARDPVRSAFAAAAPSVIGLGGRYDKAGVAAWASRIFTAVADLQEELRATIGGVSPDHAPAQQATDTDIPPNQSGQRAPRET
jgi:hypothetical protein